MADETTRYLWLRVSLRQRPCTHDMCVKGVLSRSSVFCFCQCVYPLKFHARWSWGCRYFCVENPLCVCVCVSARREPPHCLSMCMFMCLLCFSFYVCQGVFCFLCVCARTHTHTHIHTHTVTHTHTHSCLCPSTCSSVLTINGNTSSVLISKPADCM